MSDPQTIPDLADKIADKLLEEYQIGWASRFMDDAPDWDSADRDELAETIRAVIVEHQNA